MTRTRARARAKNTGKTEQKKTRAKRHGQGKEREITGKISTAKWVGPTPSGLETLWVTLRIFIGILGKDAIDLIV